MYEFRIPSKLISLTNVCMSGIKYQVRINFVVFEEFQVMIGLKQRNALSRLLFNIALEKVIRSVQGDNWATDISTNKINILCFADDFIIGNKQSIIQNTATLMNEAKAIGLAVNDNKTKVMELLTTNHHAGNVVIQGHTFEKVH